MQPLLPAYAELHCLSNFSFLRGASHPGDLVEKAHELGYEALAITDECSVAGVVRAYEAIRKLPRDASLKLIIGSEIRLDDGLKLVLLAADREGYGNLCSLITLGRRRTNKGSYRLTRQDLAGGLPGCLVLLVPGATPDLEQARFVAGCFPGRAWIAAELLCGPNDRRRLVRLRELGGQSGLPLVAAGDVHMHKRSRRPLQDVLTAIRLGVPVRQAGTALHPNGERHLRFRLRLAQLYPPELLAETLAIASRCNFSLGSLRYEYPEEIVPAGYTPTTYLRELTERGLRERFPAGVAEKVRERVENELALIGELKYEPFFLTVQDVVRFARGKKILCQGRGSAANSTVCYALGITEVNPDRMDMLFERFLSRKRNEPPDIDVDFEHQRREEVIQYIYGKYGRDRAAIAATLITYKHRSAIRDVGKALGLEAAQLDRLSKSLAWWDWSTTLRERLIEAGLDPDSRTIRQFMVLVRILIRFPRHLSQHVGGFVISRGPLPRLVPVENAAMPERSIIQWDKDDLETLGLLKVDVLALGMLSAIRRAFGFVNPDRPAAEQMKEILDRPEDDAVYKMIQKADTIGVFQIESRAQMSMLPRLRPAKFYDLVIQVAIVRPGPIQGDMVHPYLRNRKLDPGKIRYEKDELRPVLERTLGVPIFQEQVMHLAMVAARFTPDDADGLRRAMAAWKRKGGLDKYEHQLMKGMKDKGYSDAFIIRIIKQIQGFSDYGFPESHAASFALLAYASSWLKHHHPAAFLAALLNSQPMGFYSASALVQDAQRHDVVVRPVDVTRSEWDSTLERDVQPPAVRLGFSLAKNMSEAGVKRIVAARAERPFESVDDLARRAALTRRDLHAIAAAGALAPLAGHRRNAHWLAAAERPSGILHDALVDEVQPRFAPLPEGRNITADYANLGLTLGRHPLVLLRPRLKKTNFITAAELKRLGSGTPARTIGMVRGRQHPQTAHDTIFVTLEDETGYTNVIVWGHVAAKQHRVLLGSKMLGVDGIVEKEGNVVHLIAQQLSDYSWLLGPLAVESRDFH
jgi:error-prone DNA polymerase